MPRRRKTKLANTDSGMDSGVDPKAAVQNLEWFRLNAETDQAEDRPRYHHKNPNETRATRAPKRAVTPPADTDAEIYVDPYTGEREEFYTGRTKF